MRRALALVLLWGCAGSPSYLNRNLAWGSPEQGEALRFAREAGFPEIEGFRGTLAFVGDLRNDAGRLLRVLIWLELSGKMPGHSRIRAGVATPQGERLRDEVFRGGWRLVEYTGVERLLRPAAPDLFLIRAQGLAGPEHAFYFALAGDRAELVRLEAGPPPRAHGNSYSDAPSVGPDTAPPDEDEALRALGGTWTRRMSTLLWLAGDHEQGPPLGRRLRYRPSIRKAVEAFTNDPDPWIRETAELFFR
jgi:hypothetical protein